ncbi:hypothetical protein FJT64_011927 [Amphibalanus amphitrite]|uniref:Uncharacterized protein n=1 Tax=Amphibalanus amphitrite TaxID=1232801 RepID=A0A6A4V800_AMPAM|nr:hypothetical protein FJT64_011927 [Amphibalanus amphitrite]
MLGKDGSRDPVEEDYDEELEEEDREEPGSEEEEDSELAGSQITVTDAGGHTDDEEHRGEEEEGQEEEGEHLEEEEPGDEEEYGDEEEHGEEESQMADSHHDAVPVGADPDEKAAADPGASASDTDGAPPDDLHEEGFELQDDEQLAVDLGPFDAGDHGLQGAEDLSDFTSSPATDGPAGSATTEPGSRDSVEASRREHRPGAAVGTRGDRTYDADADTRGSSDSTGKKGKASPPGGKSVRLGVPGGGQDAAEGGKGGEDVFDWLRRVSCQMDEMGITDQLKAKYGDQQHVVVDNPSGGSDSEPTEVPAITITESGQVMGQRQSATQTAPAPPAAEWEQRQTGGGERQGRPPDWDGAGYVRDEPQRGRGHGQRYEERWDDQGYDEYRDDGGGWDSWDSDGDRRGGPAEWSGSETTDQPCGQCRCCRAMLRAVSGQVGAPPPPAPQQQDGAEMSLSSQQDSLLEQLRAGGGGGGSPEDLLDAEISSLTVSTGTAESCDGRDDAPTDERRVRDPRRWIKSVTDDFLRTQNIRELVLKNDLVEPGRVRSKMTRVMLPCGGGGAWQRPALSPLRMPTRLMDGRELSGSGIACAAAAVANPTRQFIDTYLERTGQNGKRKGSGRGKKPGGKTKRLITISTNLKS